MLRKSFCLLGVLMVGVALTPRHAHAQTYTESVLYNFCSQTNCADGKETGNLIQGADGNFYGIADEGGTNSSECSDIGCGTVFRITSSGTLTTLYSFCSLANCVDGSQPNSVVQGSDGNFYGTTGYGGANVGTGEDRTGGGTIFKLTPSGKLTTLYSFCSLTNCADGENPYYLVQGADGNFYGTTQNGGANVGSGPYALGGGTVYKITLSGTLTTLYSFCSLTNCADGDNPYGLVQGTDGNFYGTTANGGANVDSGEFGTGGGTVFKLTPSGTPTTLYSFCSQTNCPDGEGPTGLVQGSDGDYYGTTENGGTGPSECNDGLVGCGTAFKVTSAGALTTLHSFCSLANCTDGVESISGLMQGTDGNFYGTTTGGGITNSTNCFGGCGTVFNVSPSGTLTTVYSFCSAANCVDGDFPEAGLVQGSDGSFYSTTPTGGANISECNDGYGCGAAFKIAVSPSLAAPVQVSLSSSTIATGSTVTLTWKALNAFSASMRQCYAFVQNNASGAGKWAGLQTGSLVDGVYQGTAAITPTAEGVYVYALTCGGVESGFSGLEVGGAKAETSTTLKTSLPIVVSSSTVTLTATVSTQPFTDPLTGSVAFTFGSQALGTVTVSNGSASLTLAASALPVGTDTFTATYSGDTYYQGSAGTASVLVESKAPSTTSLNSNSPLILGSVLTLEASVGEPQLYFGTPTGTIVFKFGNTSLGTGNLSDGATSLSVNTSGIAVGTYPITATYSGDSNYASSSATTNVVIVGYTTVTTIRSNTTQLAQGQSGTLTSTVTRSGASGMPTGTITFYAGTSSIGTAKLVNGTATLSETTNGNIPPGTYAIAATYGGDAEDQPSTSGATDVTVIAATGTALTFSKNPVPAGSSVVLTATVQEKYDAGVPTGTVTFTVAGENFGTETLSAGTATVNASDFGYPAGTYPVTAAYSGDANNAASSTTVNVVVQ